MPPPGAGGGRPSSLDGCLLRQSARGSRPGARTGEGAGNGLKMEQLSKIHFKPPPGAGGGSAELSGRLHPCAKARGCNRPGARAGEGAGNGLKTEQITKIHFMPPSGVGGGSVAGEGVGIGILAERNDIKAPFGSGRGQRSGGGGGDGVVVCARESKNLCGHHAPPIKGGSGVDA